MDNMIELNESNTPIGTQINPDLNICIVKENSLTGEKTWYYAKNIVTNAGDLFYAQQAVGETPTNDFDGSSGRMELRTGSVTPAKSDTYNEFTTPVTASRKVIDSTYPKTNDGDGDNTGAGTDIVTWRTSWTTSDFTANAIIGGCIHIGGASPGASTALLTHFDLTSFNKTSTDTLKIFVNHTFNGV
jgi:hypothetical protein